MGHIQHLPVDPRDVSTHEEQHTPKLANILSIFPCKTINAKPQENSGLSGPVQWCGILSVLLGLAWSKCYLFYGPW